MPVEIKQLVIKSKTISDDGNNPSPNANESHRDADEKSSGNGSAYRPVSTNETRER